MDKVVFPQIDRTIDRSITSVLLIHLEFLSWRRARAWTYSAQLAFEEGLEANGVDFVTVLALHEFSAEERKAWFAYVRAVCASRRFDQVWIELVHLNLDDEFLAWLSSVAPVRVAIIGESLEYSQEVYAVAPDLLKRRELVERRLRYMTHALVVDEKDEERINACGDVQAMWWTGSVPCRFVCTDPPPPTINQATFFGALYGERKEWLSMGILKEILVQTGSAIDESRYPRLFNEIQALYQYLLKRGVFYEELRVDYLAVLRLVRRKLFSMILDDFRTGCAVVNLPHFVQAYSGRVFEAMAAGRPVITWEIPGRPRTKALFREDKEILLFSRNNPEQLASHIRNIQNEPDIGKSIVSQSRDALITNEKLVKRMLAWIASEETNEYDSAKNGNGAVVSNSVELETCGVNNVDTLMRNLYSHMQSLSSRERSFFRALSIKRDFLQYLREKF